MQGDFVIDHETVTGLPDGSTLQAVAPIPAFMAGSILKFRRRNDAAVVVVAFEGISFAFWN